MDNFEVFFLKQNGCIFKGDNLKSFRLKTGTTKIRFLLQIETPSMTLCYCKTAHKVQGDSLQKVYDIITNHDS